MQQYGIDSLYTGYGTNAYIIFTYIEFGTPAGGAASNWKTYSGSWMPTVGTPSTAIGTVIASYWYYDNTTNRLSIATNQCTIDSITNTELVVKFSNGTTGGCLDPVVYADWSFNNVTDVVTISIHN